MSEQSQETSGSSEPTLDDVYKEHSVEAVAESFTAQPAAAPAPAPAPVAQPQTVEIPDPAVDLDGFKTWAGQVQTADAEIRNTLHQVLSEFQQEKTSRARQAEDVEIKDAVSTLAEKVDADPEFLEIALAHKARKDPKFLAVWENRHKKPQVLAAALGAFGNELSQKFSAKSDPQLAENVRAAKQSRDQMATTTTTDVNDEWGKLSPAEFEQKWEKELRS